MTSRCDAARPSSAVLREVVGFPTPASHRPTVIDGPLQPQISGSRTRRLRSSGPRRDIGLARSRKCSEHGRPPESRQSGRLRLCGLRRPFVATVVLKEMPYEESYGWPSRRDLHCREDAGEAMAERRADLHLRVFRSDGRPPTRRVVVLSTHTPFWQGG